MNDMVLKKCDDCTTQILSQGPPVCEPCRKIREEKWTRGIRNSRPIVGNDYKFWKNKQFHVNSIEDCNEKMREAISNGNDLLQMWITLRMIDHKIPRIWDCRKNEFVIVQGKRDDY